jgi:cyanate permease
MTTQVKLESPAGRWWKVTRRILTVLVAAALVGITMRHLSAVLERNPQPAGFLRGMLQGALMPCALPNLLVGNDVTIYAPHNTGLTYKLGYTFGVNACGAVFFGLCFWRLNRWRKRLNGKS